MRSRIPFFETATSRAVISELADCAGPLVIYCGAGVSIDRTGLSWSALIKSCFPARHSMHYASGPLRGQLEPSVLVAPEQLASSLIHILRRVARESSETLRDTLRKRLKRSLYGDKAMWQAGELVPEIIQLAVMRSVAGRVTTILTTNYDDHLEEGYRQLRLDLETEPELSIPGLSVRVLFPEATVASYPPANMPGEAHSTISLVYLHGRVPRSGEVSWPIVFDENSYATTAATVGAALRLELTNSSMALIIGSSLQDPPLVRALSDTRTQGDRVVIFTKQAVSASFDEDGGSLALDLATDRASELGVRAVFTDFHGQVAQLVHEAFVRTGFREPHPDHSWTNDYMDRLSAWWDAWVTPRGVSAAIPHELNQGLADTLPILGLPPAGDPLEPAAERFRLELWVRQTPTLPDRNLVRWATSESSVIDGVNGKRGRIEAPSYLAAVKAFTEGRPQAYDIAHLETGRESSTRYTSKSFLGVPIRIESSVVGVLTLACTSHLATSSMMRSSETTENLVTFLHRLGQDLLGPIAH